MKYIFTLLLLIGSSAQAQVKFTYHWKQVSGPISVTIATPDKDTTEVTGLNVPGEYKFEFAACNDFGCGYDTVKVTVFPADVAAIDTTKIKIERPQITKLEIKMLQRPAEIWFEIQSPQYQKITCILYNGLGQTLAKADIQLKTGSNYVSLPKPSIKGVYYFKFVTYFKSITEKLII